MLISKSNSIFHNHVHITFIAQNIFFSLHSSYEFPLVFNPTATTTAKTPNLSAKNKPRASIGSASRSSFGNNEMFSHSTQQTPNSFFYRTPSPQQSPSSAVTHPPTMTQKPKPSRKSQASTITSTTSKKITFESTEKKISRSSLTSSSSESEDVSFYSFQNYVQLQLLQPCVVKVFTLPFTTFTFIP